MPCIHICEGIDCHIDHSLELEVTPNSARVCKYVAKHVGVKQTTAFCVTTTILIVREASLNLNWAQDHEDQ